MRWTWLAVVLAVGCEAPLPARPLPPLQRAEAGVAEAPRIRIVPGEHLAWNVTMSGMAVARAEWVAGSRQVRSRIRPRGFAAGARSLHHDLTTDLAAPPARQMDVHQALGWVRGIAASSSATARRAEIKFRGQRFDLEASPPQNASMPGEFGSEAIRIDLVAHTSGEPAISISAFFAVEHELAPAQVRIKAGSKRVQATLVAREVDASSRAPGLQ